MLQSFWNTLEETSFSFGPCHIELLPHGKLGAARDGVQRWPPWGPWGWKGNPFQHLGSQFGERKRHLFFGDNFLSSWMRLHLNPEIPLNCSIRSNHFLINYLFIYPVQAKVFFCNLKTLELALIPTSFLPVHPPSPFQPSPCSNLSL